MIILQLLGHSKKKDVKFLQKEVWHQQFAEMLQNILH